MELLSFLTDLSHIHGSCAQEKKLSLASLSGFEKTNVIKTFQYLVYVLIIPKTQTIRYGFSESIISEPIGGRI